MNIENNFKNLKDYLILARLNGCSEKDLINIYYELGCIFNEIGLSGSEIINKLVEIDKKLNKSTDELLKAVEKVADKRDSIIQTALKTIFTRIYRLYIKNEIIGLGVNSCQSNFEFLERFSKKYVNLKEEEKQYFCELLGGVYCCSIVWRILDYMGGNKNALTESEMQEFASFVLSQRIRESVFEVLEKESRPNGILHRK